MTEINSNNVANQQAEQAKKDSKENQTLNYVVTSSRYTRTGRVDDLEVEKKDGFAEPAEVPKSSGFVTRRNRTSTGAVNNRFIGNFDKDGTGTISDQEVFDYIAKARKNRRMRGFSALVRSNDNTQKIYNTFSMFDSVKDGKISDQELIGGILKNNQSNIEIAKEIKDVFYQNTNLENIEEVVGQVDKDQNGLVSQDEIKSILVDIAAGNFTDEQVVLLEQIMSTNSDYNKIKRNFSEDNQEDSVEVNHNLKEKLDALKADGQFDLLQAGTAVETDNEMLNTIILSRALSVDNPDAIFLDLGLDLTANQKQKILEKYDATITTLENQGVEVESALKYLTKQKDLNVANTLEKNIQDIEITFALEKFLDQATLGSTEALADDWIVSQGPMSLLLLISDTYGLSYTPEDVEGLIDNPNLAGDDIIGKIIKAYNDNGKVERLSLNSDVMAAPVAEQWDIQIFKQIINENSDLDLNFNFNVHDSKHEEVGNYIKELKQKYLNGDKEVLNTNNFDLLKDIASIYGEEINTSEAFDNLVSTPGSFVEALVLGGGVDFGVFNPSESPALNFETLETLDNLYQNVSNDLEISVDELFEIDDRHNVSAFLSNVLFEVNLGDIDIYLDRGEATMSTLFESLEESYAVDRPTALPLIAELKEYYSGISKVDLDEAKFDPNEIVKLINYTNTLKNEKGEVVAQVGKDISSIRFGVENSYTNDFKQLQAELLSVKENLSSSNHTVFSFMETAANIWGDVGSVSDENFEGISGVVYNGLVKKGLVEPGVNKPLTADIVDSLYESIQNSLISTASITGYTVLDIDEDPAFAKIDQFNISYYSTPSNGISKNWTGGLNEVWMKGKDDEWYYAVKDGDKTDVFKWDRGMSKEETIARARETEPIASFKSSFYDNIVTNQNFSEIDISETSYYSLPANGISKNWSGADLNEVWMKGKDDEWYYAVKDGDKTNVYKWDRDMSKEDTIKKARTQEPLASFKSSFYDNIVNKQNYME